LVISKIFSTKEKAIFLTKAQFSELRSKLHQALDLALDQHVKETASLVTASGQPADRDSPNIESQGESPAFDYCWPDGYEEHFDRVTLYDVKTSYDEVTRVAVAWTERWAWNQLRARAVVFYLGPRADLPPQRWYPLTEFVETDTSGIFAAPIPDPANPRAVLKDGDDLPTHCAVEGRTLRADELFSSIRNGPSLRLVLADYEEVEMVEHGFWVGRKRKRLA
jgi:hypothetical protein